MSSHLKHRTTFRNMEPHRRR